MSGVMAELREAYLGRGGGVLTVSTENMCILKDKILSHVYSARSNGHMLISPQIEQLYAS